MGSAFRQAEDWLAAMQLILAMLGMGATLSRHDFTAILKRRQAILLVLLLQYVAAPLTAVAVGQWLELSEGAAFGILLLAVMPSGALSNIFTHLGRGNLPLSITATVASTCVCLVGTPWILNLLSGPNLASGFSMPTTTVVRDVVLFLLLPMVFGMWVRRRFPHRSVMFSIHSVRASLVILAIIAVGSIGSGRIDVWEFGWTVPIVLIAFMLVQFLTTGAIAHLLRYNAADAYTLSIEVSLRNGNLAILLSSTLFATATGANETLSAGALYVALFYGGASLVIAILAATIQRRWIGRISFSHHS